ncbi:MAG: hypothetical protein ACPGSI_13740 [Pikeienuella sp.]
MESLPLLITALAFGFAACFAIYGLGVKLDGLGFATLLIAVFAIYWVEGGRVEKFSIGGSGVNATFAKDTRAPALSVGRRVGDKDVLIFSPDDEDITSIAWWEGCAEYLVIPTDEIPDSDKELAIYYALMAGAARSSLLCGDFIGFVVLDENRRYVGSFGAAFFQETFGWWAVDTTDRDKLLEMFKERVIFATALRFPETRIEQGEGFVLALTQNATIADAHRTLSAANKPFVAITDPQGVFRGVLDRDTVRDQLINSLLPDGG